MKKIVISATSYYGMNFVPKCVQYVLVLKSWLIKNSSEHFCAEKEKERCYIWTEKEGISYCVKNFEENKSLLL